VGSEQSGRSDPSLDSGGGLAAAGNAPLSQANTDLQFAAASESNRNYENSMIEMRNREGNQQMGAAAGGLAGGAIAGSEWGASAGPYGMAIGAIVGGLAGGLFK